MLPILYQSDSFILYSYPLFMGLGWGVAYQILFELLPTTFTRKRALILFWGLFLFSWLGAKILFLYTVPQELSLKLVQATSFWLGGGFVFYGGLLASLLYLAILRSVRFPVNTDVLWCLIPPLTIGHAIGRFGCFLAGCCYGKETDLFWGIFLHEAWRHPTQLLEFASLLALGLFLLRSKKPKLTLVSIYLIAYGLIRFGIEFLRGDLIRGTWGIFTPSQWISLVLIAAGAIVFIRKNKHLQRLD